MPLAQAELVTTTTLTEPFSTAVFVTVFGLLVGVAAVFSRTADRMGVPVVLLFLLLGILGGTEGIGNIALTDHAFAVRLGTIALVLILFDGGLSTSAASVRQVLAPAGVLATLGVALTAGLVAVCARLLGLDWPHALLLGAVVSSTDAAAVFAVLRGGRLQLRPRLGRTLEVESCINDPMAVILTLSIIQFLTAGEGDVWRIVWLVPVQLAVGAGVGLAFGYLGRILLSRVRMPTAGLYPALTLSIAFLSFGGATLVQGSGFLAVFLTALVIGNGPLPYRNGLIRIHDAMAWLSQITMFLVLGLLVFPSELPGVAWVGLGLGLFLAFVARPLATAICLLPFGFSTREVGYIGWIGLRGAVPIVLASFPVLADVESARHIFNIVFFIVVLSSLVPGATIRPVTRWLGLNVPDKPAPAAVLEINSTHLLNGQLVSYTISPDLVVCGARLSEIEFPPGSAAVMLVRGRELIAPRGGTVLQEGDHVTLFFKSEDQPLIELYFGRPEDS